MMLALSQKTRIKLKAALAQWSLPALAGLAGAASILTLVLILGQTTR